MSGLGEFELRSGGAFIFNGGTVSGVSPLVLRNVALSIGAGESSSAAFTMHGQNGSLAGNISLGQYVHIQGDAVSGHASVTAADGFTNGGFISLDSTDARYGATLNVTQGTLTNANIGGFGGIIQSHLGYAVIGGPRAINASIDNRGIIDIDHDTTFGIPSATYTNSGTITIATGKTLTIRGGGTFTQTSGSLTKHGTFLADTAALSFTLAGGGIDDDGWFEIRGGGAFAYNGGTINTSRYGAVLRNVALSFGAGGNLPATFVMLGQNGRLAGNISAGQEVTIQGDPCCAPFGAAATATADFTNRGKITLDSSDPGLGARLTVTNGTLTNAGTIVVAAGAGGSRSIQGNLTNTSSGTITINRNAQLGSPGSTITNNGTMSLGPGVEVRTAQARIAQTGGRLNAGRTITLSGGALDLTGGSVTGEILTQDSQLTLGTIAADSDVNLVARGMFSTLGGDVPASVHLNVRGEPGANARLTAATGFTNHGRLSVETTDTGAASLVVSGTGLLTNSGASALIAGSGSIAANVTNAASIRPGSADGSTPGILTVQGRYTQTADGALFIKLCGTTVGSGYDQLAVTGAASLAGRLVVTNISPSGVCYAPRFADTFRVLTFGSRTGDFSQPYGLPTLEAGLTWTSNLAGTFLELTAGGVRIVGGRGFGITPGSVLLSWQSGNVQSGYSLIRTAGDSGRVDLLPAAGPLPADATTYTDSDPLPESSYRYLLLPFDGAGTILGSSDDLGFLPNTQSGTPLGFTLRLNESSTASLTWAAPGGQDGYVLLALPLEGSAPRVTGLGAGETSATDNTAGIPTCYQLSAMLGGVATSSSHLVCAYPGAATLGPAGAGRSVPDAIERVRALVVKRRTPPAPVVPNQR